MPISSDRALYINIEPFKPIIHKIISLRFKSHQL